MKSTAKLWNFDDPNNINNRWFVEFTLNIKQNTTYWLNRRVTDSGSFGTESHRITQLLKLVTKCDALIQMLWTSKKTVEHLSGLHSLA
jgi:hypothetical protein